MPTYEYEFYLLVLHSISHSILSWTLEDKIHIHRQAFNIFYIVASWIISRRGPCSFSQSHYELFNLSLAWGFWQFPEIFMSMNLIPTYWTRVIDITPVKDYVNQQLNN